MENASKALIIAGAILISILLISVGIIVINAINDPVSQAGSSAESQAIQIFNAKFDAYVGPEEDYNSAKSIITTVTSVNGSSDIKSGKIPKVEIDGKTSVTELSKVKRYSIEAKDTNEDGYYDKVTISEKQ